MASIVIEVEGQLVENSEAVEIAGQLVAMHGIDGAHAIIDEIFDALSVVEGAALANDWSLWARPKQMPGGRSGTARWIAFGYLTGRGFGKTYGISKWIVSEIEDGRATIIGLAAQDEANCIALQVLGPSGLMAASPPWFKPKWEASAMQLVWPNGARAIVRTPEVPGKIRGFDYDLTWLTEIQSWPASTRDEALSNFRLATRIGLARTIWDATPKRRHPLLRELLADSEADPARYRTVRGTTHENAINLAEEYIGELEKKYGGTLRGREELLGEMLAESESALVKQKWIDSARRPMPTAFARRVLAIDPAVTSRKGSDTTGIVDAALGMDDQVLVLGDLSGKIPVHVWPKLTIDRYMANRIDMIIAETNKGGDHITQGLRAEAKERNLSVVVVGKEERPRHVHGIVYVKEIYARGPKEDRAQPASTAYERGRVSHVLGVDLASLEDTLTTWEPTIGAISPGDLDALAHAVNELLGLSSNKPDPRKGFSGISKMQDALRIPGIGPRI